MLAISPPIRPSSGLSRSRTGRAAWCNRHEARQCKAERHAVVAAQHLSPQPLVDGVAKLARDLPTICGPDCSCSYRYP